MISPSLSSQAVQKKTLIIVAMGTLGCGYRPWADLPGPPLEIIMEKLPLSDYVRFSAVCRRWSSVQSYHRHRHSPSPPSMLRLPGLISLKLHQETVSFYSPFEDKFFAVPLPSSSLYVDPLAHGWLLLSSDDSSRNPNLLHPISGAKIELPPFINSSQLPLRSCAISFSPPPKYMVSAIHISHSSHIFLLRWFDSSWIELKLPSGAKPYPQKVRVSISGKHYCFFFSLEEMHSADLLVVDPLASPAGLEYLEMAVLRYKPKGTQCGYRGTYMVEFDEEPLLVKEIVKLEEGWESITVGFDVFRADLRRKMWVKVDNIRDRVFMLHSCHSVSLLAADIGARGNCIYFSTGIQHGQDSGKDSGEAPWKVFDLGTGMVTDLMLPNASKIEKYYQELFMPTLC